MSTDPVTHEWESPYAAMGSNPIVLSDPSGANPPGGSTPLKPTPPSNPSSGNEVVWKSDESAIARNLEALMPKHRLFSMPKIDRAGGQAYVQSQGVQRSDGTTPKSWSRRKRSTEEMAYLRSLPPSTHPSGTESAPGVIRFGQGVVAGLLIGGLDFMNDPLGTTGKGIKNTAGTFGLLWLASKGDGIATWRLSIGVDNFLSLPAEEMGFEIGRSTVETAPLMVAGAVVLRASTLGLSARGAGLFAEGPAVEVTTTSATNGRIILYRAVSQVELDDITLNGIRNASGYQTGKLFATSAQDAANFGRLNFVLELDKQPFTIIETSIPSQYAPLLYKGEMDLMQGVSVPNGLFNQLSKPSILNYTPIPNHPWIR